MRIRPLKKGLKAMMPVTASMLMKMRIRYPTQWSVIFWYNVGWHKGSTAQEWVGKPISSASCPAHLTGHARKTVRAPSPITGIFPNSRKWLRDSGNTWSHDPLADSYQGLELAKVGRIR